MALEGWGTQVRVEEGKNLNQQKKRHRMNMKSLLYKVYVLSLTLVLTLHLSTMQETRVRFLGWEDPLEKEMAIHSRTIAWKIPWTEEPGRLQPMGSQRVGHDLATSLHFSLQP